MEDDKNIDEKNDEFRWGVRHTQTLLLFFGMVISYGLRVNLSVAIVAMTDKMSSNKDFIEMSWDESTKSTILSSFFWGYPITQVFVGQMAEKYGAKYFLAGALGFSAILTMITPLTAIHGGMVAMCANRMIQGLAQGAVFPSMNVLLSKWAPTSEKSRLSSFVFSGPNFGTMATLPLAGHLASSVGGWPSVFYASSVVTLTWVLFWCLLGANSPAEHGSITKAEKEYIISSLNSTTASKRPSTPWRKIFTSMPMWTLIIAHLAQNWGYMILLTNMPNYLNHVLKFDIKSNGYLSALPYLLMWILIVTFSWISDYINAHGMMSKTNQRKIWNSVAHWGGALALFSLYFFGTSVAGAMTLLTIALAVNAGTITGFFTNHLDLAPNFAGTLLGITNSVSSITSILGPLLVGFMVTDSRDKDQWGVVFLCSACIFFGGNLFYVIFGSAKVQPWNDLTKTSQVQTAGHVDESYSTNL